MSSANPHFDVLVIGSGAGGAMATLKLCQAGLKVGLVERGPRFDYQKDYIFNYANWETRPDPLNQALEFEDDISQSHRSMYRHQGRLRQRAPFKYHRVQGLGGSTLHYQGEAHRFAEHTFEQQSRYGWGVDWPIGYQDLERYYREAEHLLGVAGKPGNPFKPKREDFPTPAHPFSARSILLARSATKAGFTLLANTLALPSKSIDGRSPCQHSGTCNYGCVFGAKSSVDQAIIPKAEATGNLTIFTDSRVTSIESDADHKVTQIKVISGTQAKHLRAKHYVLALGAVETPRLLLNSTNQWSPSGFGNQHQQVGRYFMETLVAHHFFSVDSSLSTYLGPPLDARVWDFYDPKDTDLGGYVLGNAAYLTPRTGPLRTALSTKGFGRQHFEAAQRRFGASAYVFGVAEQEPRVENVLSLSKETDQAGVPKAAIQCNYSQRDLATIKAMKERLQEWIKLTPEATIGQSGDTRYQSAATHVAGTCRMGNEHNSSVVNAVGKLHASNNCWITDGSVMPTQGAGDSPSLTIQALALRTAEHLTQVIKR